MKTCPPSRCHGDEQGMRKKSISPYTNFVFFHIIPATMSHFPSITLTILPYLYLYSSPQSYTKTPRNKQKNPSTYLRRVSLLSPSFCVTLCTSPKKKSWWGWQFADMCIVKHYSLNTSARSIRRILKTIGGLDGEGELGDDVMEPRALKGGQRHLDSSAVLVAYQKRLGGI